MIGELGLISASMRPRSFERGKELQRVSARGDWKGFNEAALFRTRKASCLNNSTYAFLASMRPRSFERGKFLKANTPRPC